MAYWTALLQGRLADTFILGHIGVAASTKLSALYLPPIVRVLPPAAARRGCQGWALDRQAES